VSYLFFAALSAAMFFVMLYYGQYKRLAAERVARESGREEGEADERGAGEGGVAYGSLSGPGEEAGNM
jgi:hypothetical protein